MRALLGVGTAVLATLGLWAMCASASAQPLAGLVPDIPTGARAVPAQDIPSGVHAPRGTRTAHAAASGVEYFNGPVMHSNRTHLIFWQPSNSNLVFDPGYVDLIATFLNQVAADSHEPTNTYGLTGQYHDQTGPAAYDSTYGGAVLDTDPLPANGCTEQPPPPFGTGPDPAWTICLSSDQIDAEMRQFVAAHHLPTAAPDLYILITPDGLGDCETTGPEDCALGGNAGGYCGYHTATEGGALKYAVIPYNAVPPHCQSGNPRPNNSTADPALSTVSHEQIESITDPFGTAWLDANGNEIGDLCISTFGPTLGGSGASAYDEVIHGGHYYLQEIWSNDDGGCAARAKADRVTATGPRHVRPGHKAKFVGRAKAANGFIVSYLWSFGDGRTAHHKKVHHKYRRRGTYTVTLRVTDSDGNWASVTRTIKVG